MTDRPADEVVVREADGDDVVPALRVLEGALLDVDPDRVDRLADAGHVLVAERAGSVVGAIVVDPDAPEAWTDDSTDTAEPRSAPPTAAAHVRAVAVARRHRGRGIGTALVATAAGQYGSLSAGFRPEVEGFWTALGFEVVARVGGRLYGVADPAQTSR
ncbi:MAG: GNAT family N-acetyltransferase [Haloferacaceae archaeon]